MIVEQRCRLGQQACGATVIGVVAGKVLRGFDDGVAGIGCFDRTPGRGKVHRLHCRGNALEGGIGPDLGRNGFQAFDRGQSLQGFVHAHPVRKRGAECGLDAGIFDFRLVAPRVVGIAGDEFPERAFLRGQVGAHALHNLLGCFGRRLSGTLAQFFEIGPRGIGVRGGEDGGGQEQGEQEDFHGAVGFGRRMVTIIGR